MHAPLTNTTKANQNEVRMERVLALRQALTNGSYAVSAEDLAGRLIESMLRPR